MGVGRESLGGRNQLVPVLWVLGGDESVEFAERHDATSGWAVPECRRQLEYDAQGTWHEGLEGVATLLGVATHSAWTENRKEAKH